LTKAEGEPTLEELIVKTISR